MQHAARSRRAFTLVELMTLLAVVGVLLALWVAWVLETRARVGGMSCQSNLRLLGIAVTGYSIREGVFPASTAAGTNHSWTAAILRDLDEDPYFNALNFDLPNYDPANGVAVGLRRRWFVCPNNPLSREPRPSQSVVKADGTTYPPGSAFAPGHYGANWGGGRLPGYGDDFARTRGNYRGVMMNGGVAGRIRPKYITDGQANTILLGEKRDGQGWAVGGYAGSEFDVATSPFPADRPDARAVVAGSFHRDGSNFAFADGSVRYIDGSINRKVWYALITRDGGEAVKRDEY